MNMTDAALLVMNKRRVQGLMMAEPGLVDTPHFPFSSSSYVYADRVGDIDYLRSIRSAMPESLIPVDPFTPSQYRDEWPGVWDAVLGVPSPKYRSPDLLSVRGI